MNIPWDNTLSLSKGINALNRMYNSLASDSPLKLFLDRNCRHLLEPLSGDTGISQDYSNPNVLAGLENTTTLTPIFNPQSFESLPGSVATYAFFLEGEDNVTQCGSSIRLTNRMHTHYSQSDKNEFIFKGLPIYNYKWVPIKFSNDYVEMFAADNDMTPEEEHILTSFTQQEVRSLEQAYSTFAQPTNYKGQPVNIWHNNWVVGTVGYNNAAKRVTWITEDGTIHSRHSIDAAASALDCDRKAVHYHGQQYGTVLDTDNYGKVTISIKGVTKSTAPVDKRYDTPLNVVVDNSLLEGNKYYVYDTDMNLLPHGPYNTASEVSKALGCSYGSINLWCNYLHLIKATALGVSVYLVKRTVDTMTPVILECLTDNTVVEYPSMGRALNAMQKGLVNGAQLLSYIVNNRPFTTKEGKSYLIKYKYQEHLDVAVARLEKARAYKKAWKQAHKKAYSSTHNYTLY